VSDTGRPPGDSGLLPDDLVALGRLTRPHGISGAIRMLPYYDPPEEFERLHGDRVILSFAPQERGSKSSPSQVTPESRRVLHVADFFIHKQFVVLQFAEIQDIDDAEALRGAEVLVPPELLWAPDEGQFYIHELVGFELVESGSGAPVGTVVAIDPGTAQDFIRVRNASREFLVPFAKAIVTSVCRSERRIYVDLPAGLDEL
jgi:16S rRNA processing protein RimM